MRNLKRALSLALASVMLLGMMVIGTSAATFTDADEIVNTEAATITAGLGLFAGSEGKFNPTGTVTRAQMATVIVKMLYGSEINANSYKGSGAFSDVASFEGGWAEGYINLCANLGIVGGYGDGTFKPGKELTTAEAVTMLLNALKVDAGEGTWPMTVMAAAEKIELYEDMLTAKPTTNEALTRDQLSVLVWNALNYSEDETVGYEVNGVTYTDYLAAYLASNYGQYEVIVVKEGTLAKDVFGVKSATGIVEENQATADTLYTTIDGVEYNIETGVDMIGHNVTIYFESAVKSDKEPGVAYAIVDETKTVVIAQADGATDSRSEYRAAFGNLKKINVTGDTLFYQNYSESDSVNLDALDCDNYVAPNGTYVIDEETNNVIAYHAPINVQVDMIAKITTTEGKESIKLDNLGTKQNNEDLDEIVEYDGVAEEDLVAVTAQGELFVIEKLESIKGTITAKSTNKDNGRTVLTIDGKDYMFFSSNSGNVLCDDEISVNFDLGNSLYTKEYTVYLYNGKLVGLGDGAAEVDLSDVVYIVKIYDVEKTDDYGIATKYTYAQCVDMDGKEVNVLINVEKKPTVDGEFEPILEEDGDAIDAVLASNVTGFYTFEKCGETEGNKYGIMTGTEVETEDMIAVAIEFAGNDLDKITPESARVNTAEGIAYLASGSKLIKVSGYGATIEAGLSASMKYTVKEDSDEVAVALVSIDDNDNMVVEVLVVTSEETITTAEDVIFVTEAQEEFIRANADGYVYEVYNAKTGEILTLTFDASSLTEGFWAYNYNEADKLYEIDEEMGEEEGYLTDLVFAGSYNGLITFASDITDYDASSAIIVDTRDEDVIDSTDIEEITSLKDIINVNKEKGDNAEVTASVVFDADDEIVSVIFITSAVAREIEE